MDANNPDSEMNQLLVLQEDGTLLSVNRDIHYITRVQDVKEVIGDVGTCAVFDVSSHQFYVDVDNTSDLIVPDQFVIPQDDGTIYSNSFLIQPKTSATSESMETESIAPVPVSSQPDAQSESEVTTSETENNFTEITLTDAQYHLLEQKGWILLEISERIFVLDTLGLRDITADEKLIQKLKNELESVTFQAIEPGPVEVEIALTPNHSQNVTSDKLNVNIPDAKMVPLSDDQLKAEHITNGPPSGDTSNDSICDNTDVRTDNNTCLSVQQSDVVMRNISGVVAIHNIHNDKHKCDSIKIKTKFTFSDIPDKIYLGKTVNGKKLYAKITNTFKNTPIPEEQTPIPEMYEEAQFISLIQDYIREHPPARALSLSHVISAESVLTQLMAMPRIKHTVVGNYVIITKSVTVTSESGEDKMRRKPTVIVGEVKHLADSADSADRFVHKPYLLHNLAKTKAAEQPEDITPEYIDFIHIHVTETKVIGKPSTHSINVCNRKVSLEVIRDARKRYPTPVYACGACAALFKSQHTLHAHLQNHCSGVMCDDVLTIDMDQLNGPADSYYTIHTANEKWYACLQCEEKFLKLSNCKKHVTTHSKPVKLNHDNEAVPDPEAQEYRCKMCSTKYFHASSLSKHIVKRHIQVQPNK